ncbi:MAG: type ISP restriction/modification enzyme, partial [Bacteroidota bacterium]
MINVPLAKLTPNEHGDWISLRNDSFSEYTALAPQTKFDSATQSFFVTNSLGVASGRDSWVYNFSLEKLTTNIESSFAYYNMVLAERQINHNFTIEAYIQPTKISWNHELLMALDKQQKLYSNTTAFRMGIYRPYCEQHMYFDNDYNARQYQNKKLFPTATSTNLVICVSAPGGNKELSVLITNAIPD